MEHMFFYLISFVTLVSASGVLFLKRPIDCALALVTSMFGVAGYFALLNAHFLAVAQIAVYAGAVMVLVLFVIMLLNLNYKSVVRRSRSVWLIAVLVVFFISLKLVPILTASYAKLGKNLDNLNPLVQIEEGHIEKFSKLLFQDYLFSFELASVLILTALVGAVLIGKTKYD